MTKTKTEKVKKEDSDPTTQTTKTDYNGWTNKETWALNLHLSNSEGDYLFFRELARECLKNQNESFNKKAISEDEKLKAIWQFEDRLKEWYNEIRDNVIATTENREYEPSDEAVSLILDVSDDDELNYFEIAKSWIIDELNETEYEKLRQLKAEKNKR